jgi:hypothetical protein
MKMSEAEFLKEYFTKNKRIQGDQNQLDEAREEYEDYCSSFEE